MGHHDNCICVECEDMRSGRTAAYNRGRADERAARLSIFNFQCPTHGLSINSEVCTSCDLYARGRADERADVVAWLRNVALSPKAAYGIERGEHTPTRGPDALTNELSGDGCDECGKNHSVYDDCYPDARDPCDPIPTGEPKP